jgi:hypothetical protein
MISRRLALESALGDREVVVFSVEYAPGAALHQTSPPGACLRVRRTRCGRLQLDTLPPRSPMTRVRAAGSLHSTSQSASVMEPAKLIEFFVAEQRQVLTEPISN